MNLFTLPRHERRRMWRTIARDRRRTAAHEAAHTVVARHYGCDGMVAAVWREADFATVTLPRLAKRCAYRGQCANLRFGTITRVEQLHIAVAGSVGEYLHSNRLRPVDWNDVDVAGDMSPSDRRLGRARAAWRLAEAAEAVQVLLLGPLRDEWLLATRTLMPRGPIAQYPVLKETVS